MNCPQWKMVSIQSVRLQGKVAAYDAGGRVGLEAEVRILDGPKVVRIEVTARQLQGDDVLTMIARELIPKSSISMTLRTKRFGT